MRLDPKQHLRQRRVRRRSPPSSWSWRPAGQLWKPASRALVPPPIWLVNSSAPSPLTRLVAVEAGRARARPSLRFGSCLRRSCYTAKSSAPAAFPSPSRPARSTTSDNEKSGFLSFVGTTPKLT